MKKELRKLESALAAEQTYQLNKEHLPQEMLDNASDMVIQARLAVERIGLNPDEEIEKINQRKLQLSAYTTKHGGNTQGIN